MGPPNQWRAMDSVAAMGLRRPPADIPDVRMLRLSPPGVRHAPGSRPRPTHAEAAREPFLIGTSNGRPGLGEFALVITLAFAYPLTGVVRHSEGTEFTNAGMLGLVVFELLALASILVILRARGWSLALATPMTFRGTATGVALLIGAYVLYVAAYLLLPIVPGWDPSTAPDMTVHVSLVPLLLVVLVNPVFEEVLVVGYVLTALERFGPRIAIATSGLIRLSYHLYQGPIALPSILPMGILFASFFWWKRRLWPLIVAHGLADLIGLLAYRG